MQCTKCHGKAIIELQRHNAAFCRPHYLEYFYNQVEHSIKRHRMFTRDDRVLVAVSGGKDSLGLWHALLHLGYRASGLHLHLGIGEYSSRSYQKAVQFAQERGLELFTVDLAQDYGMGVPELARALRRVPCSACGLSKRYIMNREAYERGFTVLATGHNLDDEAATLMANVLRWRMDNMARQAPVLPGEGEKLIKKVKPLYTLTEREVAAYAILNGIDYIDEECPNALGAKSLLYKDVLDRLEIASPGTKHNFVLQFLEKVQPLMYETADEHELRECAVCGQPTTREVCSFCKTRDLASHRAQHWKEARSRDEEQSSDAGASASAHEAATL